jgi:hypothetical protein
MRADHVITIHRQGARTFVSGPKRQQSESLKTVFDLNKNLQFYRKKEAKDGAFVPEIISVGSAAERAVTGEFCHLSLDSPAQVKYAKYVFFPRVHEVLNVPAIKRKILAEKLGENVTDNADRGRILLRNIKIIFTF